MCIATAGCATCVSRLSRESHERVLVQRPRLVVRSLEDGGASHGSLGGRDEGEVLARDSQKNLPVAMCELGNAFESSSRYSHRDLCAVSWCSEVIVGEQRTLVG